MHSAAFVLEGIIQPANGDLPADLATYLLNLRFPDADHARYQRLSANAQEGTLTAAETIELDDLLTANDVLMILHSKARASIRPKNPAA